MAKWVASPEDFVKHIQRIVVQKYPKVTFFGQVANFWFRDHNTAYAQVDIAPAEDRVVLTLIGAPGGKSKRERQVLKYTEDSANASAQTICDWIDSRHKEAES